MLRFIAQEIVLLWESLRSSARSISPWAVFTENRKTTIVCKWHKWTAASRLAFIVFITECTIAAIGVSPDLTVAYWVSGHDTFQRSFFCNQFVELSTPSRMLTSKCGHAELIFVTYVYTLSWACSRGDPRWIYVHCLLVFSRAYWLFFLDFILLLEVHKNSWLKIPV